MFLIFLYMPLMFFIVRGFLLTCQDVLVNAILFVVSTLNRANVKQSTAVHADMWREILKKQLQHEIQEIILQTCIPTS